MADKRIGYLPDAADLDDASLIPAEQNGEAVKLLGEQLRQFAVDSVKEYSDAAAESAAAAANSEAAAQAAAENLEDVAKAVEGVVSGSIFVKDIGSDDFTLSALDFSAYSSGDVILVVGES